MRRRKCTIVCSFGLRAIVWHMASRQLWVRSLPAGSFAAGLLLAGCAGLLGVEDIQAVEDGGPVADGSVTARPTGDALPPPGPTECTMNAQCTARLPELVGAPGCALAECASGRCVFRALDNDGDGFTVACMSKDPARPVVVSAKLDCDDSKATVVPGTEIDCSDGTFTLPAQGECRAGKRRCQPDGSFTACAGTVGKTAEQCDGKDYDCDGSKDTGCSCMAGTTRPCNEAKAGIGICQAGTQSCVRGTYGPCTGAVAPALRDCTSPADNDCSGSLAAQQPDSQEPGCLCDGSPAGAKQACLTGLVGACSPGKKTCNVAASGATWGPCVGDIPQPLRKCSMANVDANCNGLPDQDEVACMCDGTVKYGTGAPCIDGTGEIRVCIADATDANAMWSTCFTIPPF
jgi:hypothetical protein